MDCYDCIRVPVGANIFFFFLRRYNFKEVLAFSTNSFHLGRFLMQSFQLVILMFATSLFTSSSHLYLGLPFDLVDMGVHSYTFFTMLSSGIRCACPNQANLCALMWFMIFLFPSSLFSSSFDLILHVLSFSLVGPYILLNTFLSETCSFSFVFSFNTHVSQAYVTTGLTSAWYIRGANISHGNSQVTTPDLGRDFNQVFFFRN